MLNEEERELMRGHITDDEPFGPVDAQEIESLRAREILFESHNKIYKILHKRPSIVVGRKGSGKTSYLHTVYFDRYYDYVIELSTPAAFVNIIESIEKMTKGAVFPESVADLWETVLWIGLFSQIRQKLNKRSRATKLINDYLGKIGIREEGTLDDVLWNITEVLSEKAAGKPIGIIADILRHTDTVTYKDTKECLLKELNEIKKRAVILLDSLDEFSLQTKSVSRALQGLLKCIGNSNKPSTRVDIRFCLPAELYHVFLNLSSNPNKDFRRQLTLHWVASELLLVAAQRLSLYIYLYDVKELKKGSKIIIKDKKEAQRLFDSIFPEKVTGKLGVDEDPLAYIYRHTQLLPRHLLILLNSIFDKNKKYQEKGTFKITETALRKGIFAVEEKIVREIFVAYKSVYPSAREVCEQCIPELKHKFSIGDLERVFRTHGKKAMGTDDFFDFKRMLIEIGAVGRVVGDSDKYIQGVFEYTVPYQLITSTDDMLCLHPLFTEIFSAKTPEKKSVYPYGSRIEDRDYRDWD
jgi:hypothetical protein